MDCCKRGHPWTPENTYTNPKGRRECRKCRLISTATYRAPGHITAPKRSPIERFMARVNKLPNGCWEWTGGKDSKGYGEFFFEGRDYRAHRWIYEYTCGLIPEGLELDHHCRVHHCVNPNHLEPVTHRENDLRGVGFAAIHAKKTRCPKGHAYVPENTYISPRGDRQCRICLKVNSDRTTEKRRTKRNQCMSADQLQY